ncbi:MAG: 5-oxoprolinase subunit PxpB [Planctomycetes bacterium]|jgi:inhibitor of KinA|nr:5-oxoprolinase subunit PxpB [Planctomycetota bacterium]MBT4027863.1 5-oxoprolinase subunit PxpB [Planctomycetota bacterium]MBT4559342.1 5-oxoprolinase subunit PxpB [Planctomycetota bacterium]MBT5102170.1 5-oxoprolinase subunit PxpB [Planctomycetota bacterium]MBT5120055.1 5-oxoprolinase subunit PxpB [Planctomycetota bacterium]
MQFDLQYQLFGDSAILVEWPKVLSKDILVDILAFEAVVRQGARATDLILAYHSLTICFPHAVHFSHEVSILKELYARLTLPSATTQTIWEIPVCYDQDFGIDLREVASRNGMEIDDVIRLHSQPEYLIHFIGFQPGFLYLSGLNPSLHTPRRPSPRLRVDRGSVAIGGQQTGVYPSDTPGGWNILGKSPISFFDPKLAEPVFAKPGDGLRFQSVSRQTFLELQEQVEQGHFQLSRTTRD